MTTVEEVTAAEVLSRSEVMTFLTEWEASNNVILGWAKRDDKLMPTRFVRRVLS